jgi:hypothetical protein
MSADELAAWVGKSCAAQGVPVKVTDVTVLRRVAVLLGAAVDGPRAPARSASTRTNPARLVAPNDAGPVRVQTPSSTSSGADDDVIDHCRDDGVLSVEVQV